MRYLFVFIFMLLSGISNAAEWEIGIGRTVFQPSDNGIWWQQGLDHHLNMESNSLQLGRTGRFDNGLRWRASYVYLGDVNTWGVATTDADFSGNGCISNPCAAKDTFIGRGSVDGFQFSLAPERRYGAVKLFVEAGVYAFIAHLRMTVVGNQWHTQPDVVTWFDKGRAENWSVRAMYAIGIEYDKWQLVASGYGVDPWHEDGDTIPNYQGYAYNVTLRRRFE